MKEPDPYGVWLQKLDKILKIKTKTLKQIDKISAYFFFLNLFSFS